MGDVLLQLPSTDLLLAFGTGLTQEKILGSNFKQSLQLCSNYIASFQIDNSWRFVSEVKIIMSTLPELSLTAFQR